MAARISLVVAGDSACAAGYFCNQGTCAAKGTAGAAATTKKTMQSSPGYMWNVNHTVPIDDPMELFPVHMTEGGV